MAALSGRPRLESLRTRDGKDTENGVGIGWVYIGIPLYLHSHVLGTPDWVWHLLRGADRCIVLYHTSSVSD